MGLASQFSLSTTEQTAYTSILQTLDGFSDSQREKIVAMVGTAIAASKATSPKHQEDTYITRGHEYHNNW